MKIINRILFPTDFSSHAEIALQYAIEFVKNFNAHLVILHAYKVPIQEASVITIPEVETKSEMHYELRAKQHLERMILKNPQLWSISYQIKIEPDFPVDCIIKNVEAENIDLIIMGTHGTTGLKNYFLGSNTENVIENVECPVLAIPYEADFRPIQTIGFAYDYKEIDPERLEILKAVAKRADAQVHVITVVPNLKPGNNGASPSISKVEDVLSNVEHFYDLQLDDEIDEGIYNYVAWRNIDLLTVLPRKHGFFEKLLRTSITKKLINHAKVPILVV